MDNQILQEKLTKLEREINWYISERGKVEAKMTNLEAEKSKILEGFAVKNATTKDLTNVQSGKQLYQRVDPKSILNSLETLKAKLESLEQNLNKTFRTVDDVIRIGGVIYNYRGTFSKLLNSANSLTKSNPSGSATPNNSLLNLGELTKLPIVRNLAKELLGGAGQR